MDLIPDRIVDLVKDEKKKAHHGKSAAKTEGIWDLGSYSVGQ